MTRYRERLSPSPWVFFATALVLPASIIVFAPIWDGTGWPVGVGVGIVLYAGALLVLILTSPVIEVTGDTLRVGRASIPLELIGECEAFTGADATAQRGRLMDVRAWLCIRGWVDPVVKMRIADPLDPTPYWLVSTRRPGDLIDAVSLRGSSS
ncbi:DUF3093 domain-containing protein [Herbiconiux solani]|uniref:DUF3093 domain-containing protein n=1 Tax=Herbiconiux solani TaxID=661329 RepID=UPI0008268E70|nr:DUF3093 domain-containing protein [Herbiconiux solani]